MRLAVLRLSGQGGSAAAGYCARMGGYLGEMFPLPLHGALALLLYGDLAWLIHRLAPRSAAEIGYAAAGVLSILALDLLMRLMDEIKDKDIDARYFPHRPLPSGRVTEIDLRVSQALAALLFLGCALASPATIPAALVLLAYSIALSRHLLLRSVLERSPLLTLLTHSPLVPAMLLYVLGFTLAARHLGSRTLAALPTLAMLGMLWLLVLCAEIARKIRAPAEETGYLSYSRAWGRQCAVLATFGAASLALVAALYLLATLGGTPLAAAPCLIGYAAFAVRCYQCMREATPQRARLFLAAQLYGFATLVAFPLDRWCSA